jgi:hypothetical protein
MATLPLEPRRIQGPAGARIRILLGRTGDEYLLILNEDDGMKEFQTVTFNNIPPQLEYFLSLVDCVNEVSFCSNGDCFLDGRLTGTQKRQTFYHVGKDETLQRVLQDACALPGDVPIRVVFGRPKQWIVLTGGHDFTLGAHVPGSLKKSLEDCRVHRGAVRCIRAMRGNRFFLSSTEDKGMFQHFSSELLEVLYDADENGQDIFDVDVCMEEEKTWVVIGAKDFVVHSTPESEVHPDLLKGITLFYKRHRKRAVKRLKEIKDFRAMQHDQVIQNALKNVIEKRELDRVMQDLSQRGIKVGSRVTVQGLDPEIPGNGIVEHIDASTGAVRVISSGPVVECNGSPQSVIKETEITIHDPRLVVIYHDETLEDEQSLSFIMALAASEDKYEASMAQFRCFCKPGTVFACRKLKAWRSSFSSRLKVGERVHVTGHSDGTILSLLKSKTAVQIKLDRPTLENIDVDTFPVDQIRRKEGTPYCGDVMSANSHAFFGETIAVPFLEHFGEVNPYDEFKCAEKIDMIRLQKVVQELRKDTSVRKKYLGDLQEYLNNDEATTSSETDEFCHWMKTLKRCAELEETASGLLDHMVTVPMDPNGCAVQLVNYRHKDAACRGRLFASGRHVYEDQCPRVLALQGLLRELREKVVGAFAHDFDCENSETRILCSLAAQMGIEQLIPTLLEYRDNRARWLRRIRRAHSRVSEAEAKGLPNLIFCGGTYLMWTRAVGAGRIHNGLKSFMFMLYQEVRVVRDQLLIEPRFQWTQIERKKLEMEGRTPGAIELLLFRRIIESCENEIMRVVHQEFQKNNWIVRAKIMDGIIAEPLGRAALPIADLQKLVEVACNERGWDVKLAEKPLLGLQDKPLGILQEARSCLNDMLDWIKAKGSVSTNGGLDEEPSDILNVVDRAEDEELLFSEIDEPEIEMDDILPAPHSPSTSESELFPGMTVENNTGANHMFSDLDSDSGMGVMRSLLRKKSNRGVRRNESNAVDDLLIMTSGAGTNVANQYHTTADDSEGSHDPIALLIAAQSPTKKYLTEMNIPKLIKTPPSLDDASTASSADNTGSGNDTDGAKSSSSSSRSSSSSSSETSNSI